MTSTKIWRSDTFAYTTNLKYIEYDDLKWKTSKNMLLHYFWHVWLNFPYSSFSAVIIDYRFLPCVTFLCIFLPALDSSNEASCWTWFAATSCSFRLSFSQQKVALFPHGKKCVQQKYGRLPRKVPSHASVSVESWWHVASLVKSPGQASSGWWLTYPSIWDYWGYYSHYSWGYSSMVVEHIIQLGLLFPLEK